MEGKSGASSRGNSSSASIYQPVISKTHLSAASTRRTGSTRVVIPSAANSRKLRRCRISEVKGPREMTRCADVHAVSNRAAPGRIQLNLRGSGLPLSESTVVIEV